MEMKKLHIGAMSFGSGTMDEIVHQVAHWTIQSLLHPSAQRLQTPLALGSTVGNPSHTSSSIDPRNKGRTSTYYTKHLLAAYTRRGHRVGVSAKCESGERVIGRSVLLPGVYVRR